MVDARTQARAGERSAPTESEVVLALDGIALAGSLVLPERAAGIVAFAHGSGSGRLSPRNRLVASILNAAGLGTLLFDLLTEHESLDRRNVFDIPLLAGRLTGATGWLAGRAETAGLPLGYFGASTGAAAALWAAGTDAGDIRAIVSRGGRPDLAISRLDAVRAPTLLIVGGADQVVLELNRGVLDVLPPGSELRVVPGATHLFEEPGALREVAVLARDWFTAHLQERLPNDAQPPCDRT